MVQRNIYLIRHGAIDNKGSKRFIGQIDLPINAEGIAQAKGLKGRLRDVGLSAVFCSDLKRSIETAEIIAEEYDFKPIVNRRLREISLGKWDGQSFDEIRRRFPKEFDQRGKDIFNFCPPDGESFKICSERVLAEYKNILQSTSGNILIVGHAGVNRIILCHLLGMPMENLFRIGQDYGCLNIISYLDKEKYSIKLLNQTL
ncbi:alpha-ribazole phosphatase [Desulfofalx alkaliphila]|uniref:alpha-ribazole phosphatase n=1 Tax=Desulfofalx alkaliphila TaxID=105483 RepID=UPI0004E161B0|nr:alpha-ribazole phosphatase [Desulfofalx alkaliphila]